jgi:hypothetical protein
MEGKQSLHWQKQRRWLYRWKEGGGDEEGSQDVIQTITNNGRSSSNLVHVDVKDGNLHSRICAFFFYHVRSSALFSLLEINARSNMNVIDIRLDQAVTRFVSQ